MVGYSFSHYPITPLNPTKSKYSLIYSKKHIAHKENVNYYIKLYCNYNKI